MQSIFQSSKKNISKDDVISIEADYLWEENINLKNGGLNSKIIQ